VEFRLLALSTVSSANSRVRAFSLRGVLSVVRAFQEWCRRRTRKPRGVGATFAPWPIVYSYCTAPVVCPNREVHRNVIFVHARWPFEQRCPANRTYRTDNSRIRTMNVLRGVRGKRRFLLGLFRWTVHRVIWSGRKCHDRGIIQNELNTFCVRHGTYLKSLVVCGSIIRVYLEYTPTVTIIL